MVKEINQKERKGYITGAIDLAREKAESAIDAYKRGNYGQVISSLYYSYFHIIKAILYKKGFDPVSHEGVYALLNLHFVKSGVLDKGYSRLFERLHKNREIADYNPIAPKFDKKDADNFVIELSDLTPEIIGIIKNYREYTIKLTKSIIELKRLTK
ncbi:MAG: HEPN domain-containing protein [Nitrospirae bacterium]|nr:HEPN domain-containing protein [Nitrospirota bacterium]